MPLADIEKALGDDTPLTGSPLPRSRLQENHEADGLTARLLDRLEVPALDPEDAELSDIFGNG